jgi:hypothetical protein
LQNEKTLSIRRQIESPASNGNVGKRTSVPKNEAAKNPSFLHKSVCKLWRTTMDNGKQKLKLEENIAAVRFTEFSAGNDVKGVAVTIPAGEIVDLDRQAPVVGHMREIEWKGSRYGVFPDDLLERTDKLQADRSAATSNR